MRHDASLLIYDETRAGAHGVLQTIEDASKGGIGTQAHSPQEGTQAHIGLRQGSHKADDEITAAAAVYLAVHGNSHGAHAT